MSELIHISQYIPWEIFQIIVEYTRECNYGAISRVNKRSKDIINNIISSRIRYLQSRTYYHAMEHIFEQWWVFTGYKFRIWECNPHQCMMKIFNSVDDSCFYKLLPQKTLYNLISIRTVPNIKDIIKREQPKLLGMMMALYSRYYSSTHSVDGDDLINLFKQTNNIRLNNNSHGLNNNSHTLNNNSLILTKARSLVLNKDEILQNLSLIIPLSKITAEIIFHLDNMGIYLYTKKYLQILMIRLHISLGEKNMLKFRSNYYKFQCELSRYLYYVRSQRKQTNQNDTQTNCNFMDHINENNRLFLKQSINKDMFLDIFKFFIIASHYSMISTTMVNFIKGVALNYKLYRQDIINHGCYADLWQMLHKIESFDIDHIPYIKKYYSSDWAHIKKSSYSSLLIKTNADTKIFIESIETEEQLKNILATSIFKIFKIDTIQLFIKKFTINILNNNNIIKHIVFNIDVIKYLEAAYKYIVEPVPSLIYARMHGDTHTMEHFSQFLGRSVGTRFAHYKYFDTILLDFKFLQNFKNVKALQKFKNAKNFAKIEETKNEIQQYCTDKNIEILILDDYIIRTADLPPV